MNAVKFKNIAAGACFLCVGGGVVHLVTRPVAADVDQAFHVNQRLDGMAREMSGTNQAFRDLIKDLKDSADDNYYDVKASAQTTATILRQTSDLIADFRAQSLGGKDAHGVEQTGTVPLVNGLVAELKTSVQGVTADVHSLTQNTGEVTTALKSDLTDLDALIKTLDQQIKDGSPKVVATIESLRKTIDDADTLLQPGIDAEGNPTGVAGIIYHTDESMKSIDIALRVLREKLALAKRVLNFLLDKVKATIALK